jgi:hypothetical protein
MQRFHQRPNLGRRPDDPFISEFADACLYLSGYAILPLVFLFVGINGPKVSSPVVLAILFVMMFWGVLTVRYLPRVGRGKSNKERNLFRNALLTVGLNPDRWGFLWYVSMGLIIGVLATYWIRFILRGWID